MNTLSNIHLGAVAITFTLGLMVLRTNPRRATNQIFAIISYDLGLWLICMAMAFVAPSDLVATLCIRGCHSLGATFHVLFDCLRLSVLNPSKPIRTIFRENGVWLGITLTVAAISQTPWVIQTSYIPALSNQGTTIPEPVFNHLLGSYVAFHAASLGLLIWRFSHSLARVEGVQRAELHFILLGTMGSIITGAALAIVPPIITGSAQSAKFASLGVIVLDSIIAFGIATRRIMDMAYLFRLLTSYALLTAYLGILYLGVWWPLAQMAVLFGLRLGPLPHILASVVVAFSMAPANGWMQRFANRLFIHSAPLSIGAVVKLTNQLLRSISTVDTLLGEFAGAIAKAVGTDQISVLLAVKEDYIQFYPQGATPPLSFSKHDPLPSALMKTGEVIVPDVLRRLKPDASLAGACTVMDQIHCSVAVSLCSKEGLEGIMLLGPKLTGRIYGAPEQHALQLLCNQFAVALNNARLYTQLQDGKIYNDILVDSLVSGIIAANQDGKITVFNREAQRLTQLPLDKTVNCSLFILPPALATLLTDTIAHGEGIRDRDVSLFLPSGDPIPIRVSSSVFYGHSGTMLGAFLVMTDLTTVRQLELQIRRTDRLASLGTLAAGMAHEIKNPLVSIKTFTQLLPERYDDADFRDTFSSLVGGEVKRIDSIVNQLLRFSRPSKPVLAPSSLHEILSNSLKLIQQQLHSKNIQLIASFTLDSDRISADGDQLGQALINFFLNAIESMPDGGTLTVTTQHPPRHGENGARHTPTIWLSIQDTGSGIAPENLSHIFDPFFTTKSQGTGLGLSVAHGIIQEHSGSIDIQSQVGQGTTFILTFPLIEEEKPS